jgi:ribonuclease G
MSPHSTIVINADGPETRVAVIENGMLAELYIERKRGRGVAGNVYKGRVVRVLPGMQAAFVDIGIEKAAFLYVGDVRGAPDDYQRLFALDEDERSGNEEDEDERQERSRGAQIQDLLKEGQEILVQVAKEPMGTKGARITSYVSLPGRHLVFMPTVDHIGISRRIQSDKERKRLRDIVESMRPKGAGFIVRTVAEGVPEADLRADMDFLIKLWNETLRRAEKARAPAPLYSDLDLLLRTVRDLFTEDVDALILDSRPEYERAAKFVNAFMPQFATKVQLYEGPEPIFDGYGIEIEIDRALERKVWLKSGGYLIIDQGEALTAIDVNTGRFVGKRNLEETITKTNLEACKEVAEQLRLRNLGGIIVVDFIDMDREVNREKVSRAFHESLRKDKARINVTKISDMGLVEMTRKRTRESLGRMLTEPCFYCEGKGYLKSKATICYELLREVKRQAWTFRDEALTVTAHPEIANLLMTTEHHFVEALEKKFQKRIVVRPKERFHLEQYEIKQGSRPEDRSDRPEGSAERGPNGKAGERKPEERKPEERKPEERKGGDRKAEERKAEERKAEERKAEERKAEERNSDEQPAPDAGAAKPEGEP